MDSPKAAPVTSGGFSEAGKGRTRSLVVSAEATRSGVFMPYKALKHHFRFLLGNKKSFQKSLRNGTQLQLSLEGGVAPNPQASVPTDFNRTLR